eukprot:CAMPEP_0196572430 /NCGR_PEP_ID=MMETSP1081-20130531/2488_1 /TAXON_ID=36882 /ORGANISM="Pyramimonas amylifera, Strain CCMP720" /LENGTH=436 /DNA_ID=CAMNT_0041889757 /DNA_START=104 /DNA_END=1414 /DNA_ORIENTATION=-
MKVSGGSRRTVFIDYYKILSISPQSTPQEIKMAYRVLQKRCHPDIAGDIGHNMASLLNEAYSVLSSPPDRLKFDEDRFLLSRDEGFTGKPLSAWAGDPEDTEAYFVDELACIGCLQCALLAEKTFAIETTYGKARVLTQWGDSKEVGEGAQHACPVSCIHLVPRSQLPVLEHVMQATLQQEWRGREPPSPFQAAQEFVKRRQEREAQAQSPEAQREEEMMRRAAEEFDRSSVRNNIVPARNLALPSESSVDLDASSSSSGAPMNSAGSAGRSCNTYATALPKASLEDLEELREAAARWAGEPSYAEGDGLEDDNADSQSKGKHSQAYWRPPAQAPVLSFEQMAAMPPSQNKTYSQPNPTPTRDSGNFGAVFLVVGLFALIQVLSVRGQSSLNQPGVPRMSMPDGITDNERVVILEDHARRARDCYAHGGGLCRFML